jgi:hypothetical protein
VWYIFEQLQRSGIRHCQNDRIDRNSRGCSIDILKFSCAPRAYVIYYVIILRHHPTSSSFLPESDLYIQGRDEKLITIGNRPVFPQSLILTSDRQVLVPQASVQVTSFVTARTPAVPGTLSTVPGPLLKQLLRL